MIPANDDNFDEEPTSSSASNSEPIKSPKIIISKNSPLKSGNYCKINVNKKKQLV